MRAVPGNPHGLRRLPRRPALAAGQALDSYLEQLADANHLRPGDLARLLTASSETTRFLITAPTETTLQAIVTLTGLPAEMVRGATLGHYDGTALDLTGLDPHRLASYRTVAARGWFPGNGTQICPHCLAGTPAWRLAWRLPTTTVCTTHRIYLLSSCPTCVKPFRASRHSLLRPVGSAPVCGNSQGVRGRHCRTDLTGLTALAADTGCIDRQQRYEAAITDGTTTVLGVPVAAGSYHQALRSLTVLLLHIATVTADPTGLPDWARQLRHRASTSTQSGRSPRWGLAPPDDPPLRSRALTSADRILAAADLEGAVTALAAWADAVPVTRDGFLGWVGDHSTPTPTVTRLVMAVHAPRRRLSRALDALSPLTADLASNPQVIPGHLYEKYLTGLFDSRPGTVRTFAALCLARTHPGVDTWTAAADALGLPSQLGVKTAQACAAAHTADTTRVTQALRALALQLDPINYRACEQQIRDLCHSGDWFTTWTQRSRPGTHPTSIAYAITWLWAHTAHGHIDTSPAWKAAPTARQKARYRRFATSLTARQRQQLRHCALMG